MQQNTNNRMSASTVSNFRKRPHQTLMTNNQVRQPSPAPGPSGAAAYQDLMPVGGFNRNFNRQGNVPNSGHGAATSNRNGNKNIPRRQQFKTNFQPGAGLQAGHGPCQMTRGQNTPQSGMRGPYNQFNNTDAFNSSTAFNHNENNYQGNNISQSAYSQSSWNNASHPYTNNMMFEDNNVVGNIGPLAYPNTGHYNPYQQQQQKQQQQQQQQWNPNFQGHGGMGLNGRQTNYGPPITNTANYNNANLAGWNNSFAKPAAALPGTSNPSGAKDTNHATKVNNSGKTAITELKKSLHFLTVDTAGVKRWSKLKDSVQIVFEVFGQLDSAVTRDKMDSKQFLIRDDKKNAMTCIFYEIDRQLPKLTRGQWYRVVGTFDESKELFKCFSIRPLQSTEGNLAPLLSQKTVETMNKLARSIREP